MTELNYYGNLITVTQCDDGTFSWTINGQTVSGFSTEDEAFDDACCRIDAIRESW
ncbi:hypothetical protein ACE1CI_03475 [Aerosakkonemataceae cyanobacterium BLCC-F50]|uniref:Uncharacterized protein n=1 Tax=Floridaenema flaviceps BLCC-F50 TaxID=3153642 RepID=A0ABV4XJV4_9CYAN